MSMFHQVVLTTAMGPSKPQNELEEYSKSPQLSFNKVGKSQIALKIMCRFISGRAPEAPSIYFSCPSTCEPKHLRLWKAGRSSL